MKSFKAKISGKIKQLKHYSRHRANCRRVCALRYKAHLESIGEEYTRESNKVFTTAFNMGYNHGRKRHLALEKKVKKNNLKT